MTGKFVSYLRVSTQEQGKAGLGLEAQRQAVVDYLNGRDWHLCGEFVEVESGKRNNRPKLAEALALAKAEGATLVIAKLDRLARNVAFIANLLEAGVEVVACDMPTANKFMLHVMAAVAEQEAKAISDRTKAALAAAKARGTLLGWSMPSRQADQQKATQRSLETRQASAARHAQNIMPLITAMQISGISTLAGIARELNSRGAKSPRGGRWHASTIQRIITQNRQGSANAA